MDEIKELDLDAQSRKEMLGQILISANQYLDRALPEINILAEGFYQGASDTSWQGLLQFLDGIQWLLDSMTIIVGNRNLFSNWYKFEEISTNLQNQLYQFEEALKVRDVIMIGDILNFEIDPILLSLKNELQNYIDNEANRHDFN